MSKLTEILALIPKGLQNIDKVVEGYLNKFKMDIGTLPEDEQHEIIRRRVICDQCPLMSENARKIGMKIDRTDQHCTACGCPIIPKTASLSSNCGLEEYNKLNPEHPIPLKWFAYESK